MSKHSWHDWSTLNKQRNIADPKKCDLMYAVVGESHFTLEKDAAMLRHTDVILPWLKG